MTIWIADGTGKKFARKRTNLKSALFSRYTRLNKVVPLVIKRAIKQKETKMKNNEIHDSRLESLNEQGVSSQETEHAATSTSAAMDNATDETVASTSQEDTQQEPTSQETVSTQMEDAKQDNTTSKQEAVVQQETSLSSVDATAETGTNENTRTLQDLEGDVQQFGNNGLIAGKALETIKRTRKFKERDKSWDRYCRTTFGFSPQYANSLISSWLCFKTQREKFEQENRSMAFKSLPRSVNFWKQGSRIKDAEECHASLNGLLDSDNNLVSNWAAKWAEANSANAEEVDGKSAKENELNTLASNLRNVITENEAFASAVSALNPQDLKAFIRTLVNMLNSTPKDADNDKNKAK